MKKLFKYLLFALCLEKLISTVLFFANSQFNDLFSYTCAFGIPYGMASCLADNSIEPMIGALTVILEANLLPIFLLIGAFTQKSKVLRGSAIVLGALSLVDAVCCVISMWMMPLTYKTVNLLFSLVIVVVSVITAVQDVKQKKEQL